MQKPPAFQFYVKDWRSSGTVRRMSREERGTYIDLLALAWEHEGILPADPQAIAHALFGYNARSISNFLSKFPQTFPKVSPKFGESLPEVWSKFGECLVNLKLRKQYEELGQYKQKQRDAGIIGNQVRWGNTSQPDSERDRSAFASASASAKSTTTPPYPPTQTVGGDRSRNGRRLTQTQIEARVGSGPEVVRDCEADPERIRRHREIGEEWERKRREGDPAVAGVGKSEYRQKILEAESRAKAKAAV